MRRRSAAMWRARRSTSTRSSPTRAGLWPGRPEQVTDRRDARRYAGTARRGFRHFRAAPREARHAPPLAAADHARLSTASIGGAGQAAARGPRGVPRKRRHRGLDAAPPAAAGEVRRRRADRAEIRADAEGRPAGRDQDLVEGVRRHDRSQVLLGGHRLPARPSPWPR